MVDEPLGLPELSLGGEHLRVLRAELARQVRYITRDVGILLARLLDHVRGQRLVERAGIGVVLDDALHLLVFGVRLGGLHMRLNQLIVEVGELLIVDGDALGGDQVIGGAEILDLAIRGLHPRLQPIELAPEPGGGDLVGVMLAVNLLIEI